MAIRHEVLKVQAVPGAEPVVCSVPFQTSYRYSCLRSLVEQARNVSHPKTTVDYWIGQAFLTDKPRSVVCGFNGVRRWVTYLAFKEHYPCKSAYPNFLEYLKVIENG